MNNSNHPIDDLFRQKLNQHQVNPSPLAWKKLSSQLNNTKRHRITPWFKVAAFLVIIMTLGLVLWELSAPLEKQGETYLSEGNLDGNPDNKNLPSLSSRTNAAEDSEMNSFMDKTKPSTTIKGNPQEEIKNETQYAPLNKKDDRHPFFNKNNDIKSKAAAPIAQLPRRTLDWEIPQPQLDRGIKQDRKPNGGTPETLPYTVTIKSSGISKKPASGKMVNQIEEKINAINDLLSKVDQGYAQLQDAKDNLFASLINKTEQRQENH